MAELHDVIIDQARRRIRQTPVIAPQLELQRPLRHALYVRWDDDSDGMVDITVTAAAARDCERSDKSS
jgi:hypothetical protein